MFFSKSNPFVNGFASIAIMSVTAFVGCKSLQLGKKTSDSSFGTFSKVELKLSDLTPAEQMRLYEADKQRYEAAEGILINRYLEKFFKDYMDANKLPTVDAAKSQFFSAKANVTEEQVNAFLEKNKDNPSLQQIPADRRAMAIREYLMREARNQEVFKLVNEAREKGEFKLTAFEKPEAPVIQFKGGFSRGSDNAKVVISEFADYECSHCIHVHPILKKVVDSFGDKVRFTYHDFPLTHIHPQALPAAIAASCAHKQGKYWDMHNKLYQAAETASLSEQIYQKFAEELKLDMTKFKECLADKDVEKAIMTGMEEGTNAGVEGTPTIYINGRKFEKMISEEKLRQEIESLLADSKK